MKHLSHDLLMAMLALTLPLAAATYKYDFSNDKGPVQEGFVKVTEKNSDDIQWKGKNEQLKAMFTPYSYEIKNNVLPTRYPINLSAGNVQGRFGASFRLPKVAPGKYHLWALCGLAGGNPRQVWDIQMTAGGGSRQLTFAGSDEIMEMDFEAQAGADGLDVAITSRGSWVLNAIVAISADEWKAARDGWLKALREEIFILPTPVRQKWSYQPRKCTLPEPKWTDKQKADGLAVYTRNWATPIWPDHFPEQAELSTPVRAFASFGEKEILNFAIYPLKDFENVRVTVSDLVNESSGYRICSSEIDVRYVRYMYVRPNYNIRGTYYRAPDVLMPWRGPVRGIKGENLRAWLTVNTPTTCHAGFYRGAATITADDVTVDVPLTLRVLPIVLTQDESLTFGQYYYTPQNWINSVNDDFSRRWYADRIRFEHEFMRDYAHLNYNTSIGLTKRNGKYYPDVDGFQKKMDTVIKYGMTRPMPTSFGVGTVYAKYMEGGMGSHLSTVKVPPQEFFDEITEIVRLIHREAVRRQWPELLFYPVDEPSTATTSVMFMTKIMEAIKKVPGVRTYVTADPSHEQFEPMKPFVDVWCCQPYAFPREKVLKDMAERPGLEYWCYPNHISGENDHTPCTGARMTYGFGLWNSGFRCLIPWIFGSSNGSQWNYLDSKTSDFSNRYDMDGSVIPVTLWAAYAEGMDDGRYINTLEKTIAQARDDGFNEAADNAQASLDFVRSSINIQLKYKTDDLWNADAFDCYRWLLATEIMKLQNQMKQ